MQLHKGIWNSLSRGLLAAGALAGVMLFAGVPSARANDWDDCNRRAAYTDWRYHEAVEHFGFYSSEAAYWRQERDEALVRLDAYRRHSWRERAWRENEWREHEWREQYRHHQHHDWDDDWDD